MKKGDGGTKIPGSTIKELKQRIKETPYLKLGVRCSVGAKVSGSRACTPGVESVRFQLRIDGVELFGLHDRRGEADLIFEVSTSVWNLLVFKL